MLKSLAQSTIDYLILAGVIMVVIIPLLFFSGNKLDAIRESQIVDAAKIIQNAVIELINLGYGSATERVVQIPTGILSQQIIGNRLILNFKNRDLIFEFGFNIAGTFPINPGRHYIKLFNNGTHIIFSICGNNIIEPPEQCDGTALPPGAPLGTTCYPPGSPNACRLYCDTSIIPPITCPYGMECLGNVCTPTGFCGNNLIEDFEECDPPGSICLNGNICDANCLCGIAPPPTCSSSSPPLCGGTCPVGYTCDDVGVGGSCTCVASLPCGSSFPVCTGTCDPGYTCQNTGSLCQCVLPTCSSFSPPLCGGTCPDPTELCLTISGSCQCTNNCTISGYTCLPGTSCNYISGECIPVPPPATCPSTLMAYWDFNEPPGSTTVTDSVGSYVGNLLGNAGIYTWSGGSLGNALLVGFNTNTDKVHFPTFNPPSPEGTLEMLIMPGTVAWSLDDLTIIAEAPNPAVAFFTCFALYRDDISTKIKSSPAYGDMESAYSFGGISNIYHIAVTWTAVGSISYFELFINGVPQATGSYPGIPDCLAPFYVGGPAIALAGATTGFAGVIDELMIFSEKLNQATIQQHAWSNINKEEACIPVPFPLPCGSSFPVCTGTCAAGQTCVSSGTSCSCVTPCSSSSAPTCGGYCPPSQTCMDISGSCQCGTPATCGNSVVDPPEQCDCGPSGAGPCDWGSASITNPNAGCWQGQYCIPPGQPNPCTCTFTNTGSPQCTASCPAGTCGDGVIGNTPGEECDGGGCGAGEICLNCICIPDPGGGTGTGGTVG